MSKKCIENGCTTFATFNFENEKQRLYCSKHKLKDMVNVVSKTCKFSNCTTRPNYNYQGEKQGIYCSEHKLENMVDVTHKRCLNENCKRIPSCNYSNEKQRLYCSRHKLENMINVVGKTCKFENCKIQPNYNYKNKKEGIYCLKHKLENMENVKHKKCECGTRQNVKYKPYCTQCFIFYNPGHVLSFRYKSKENFVFNKLFELDSNIKELSIRDKPVGGCSKRRPDLMLDLITHWICVENDENCHKNYEEVCENRRTMELYTDMSNRPMVLIRFNCDKYEDGNSLFIDGKEQIKIRCIREFNNRINELRNTINKYITFIPEKSITVEYLYYNKS